MKRSVKLSALAAALVVSVASWAAFESNMNALALQAEIQLEYANGVDIVAIVNNARDARVANIEDLIKGLVAAAADPAMENNASVAVATLIAAGYDETTVRSAALATNLITADAISDAVVVGRVTQSVVSDAASVDTPLVTAAIKAALLKVTVVDPVTRVVSDIPTNSPDDTSIRSALTNELNQAVTKPTIVVTTSPPPPPQQPTIPQSPS